jgi:hypothetical protein
VVGASAGSAQASSRARNGPQHHNGRSVQLQFWLELGPDVPAGDWYKDFGTFKLAGRGPLVLTFLSPEQIPWGTAIADTGIED